MVSDNGHNDWWKFIRDTHWMIWVILTFWLYCLWLCVIYLHKERYKRIHVSWNNDRARGIVIANNGTPGKGKHKFTTTYIFNTASSDDEKNQTFIQATQSN